jgi:hypothetical protein
MQLEKGQRYAKAHITRIFGWLSRFVIMLLVTAIFLMPPAAVLAQQPAFSRSSASVLFSSPASRKMSL